MEKIHVIGIGMGLRDLTPRHREIIEQAQVLVGGRRLLELFPEVAAEKIPVTRDIAGVVDSIRSRMAAERVVVLASGDPLFYGIGATLVRELGTRQVRVHPNVTTVAAAFARLNQPWGQARIISFHGRDARDEMAEELQQGSILALLTDPKHNPAWIGKTLLERGLGRIAMCVLERLGLADEKVRWLTPAQAVEMQFSDPNLVVLQPPQATETDDSAPLAAALGLGMADEDFLHERGMITKTEVRAVSLAKLRLRPGQTLWDLGAGSGSVGIEAAVLLGSGRIAAVEKNPARAAQIEANASRFGVTNLTVHRVELPQGLDDLPDPDRVFIGGGGKDITAMLEHAARRLPLGGIIVVNLVVLQNLAKVMACCERLDLATEIVQLQVQRSRSLAEAGDRLEALNPVWIVTVKILSQNF